MFTVPVLDVITGSGLRSSWIPLIALVALVGCEPAPSEDTDTDTDTESEVALADLLDGMGGEDAIRQLATFSVESEGARWIMDEGPMPGEGASTPSDFELTLAYDVPTDRLALDYTVYNLWLGVTRSLLEVVDGNLGAMVGIDRLSAPPGEMAMSPDRTASTIQHQRFLNPHLLLVQALDDPTLVQTLGTVEGDGASYQAFRMQGTTDPAPIDLYFDADAGMLAEVHTTESDPLRRDVEIRVQYTNWTEFDEGAPFPATVRVLFDGELVHEETRSSVDTSAGFDDAVLDVVASVGAVHEEHLFERGVMSHQSLQNYAAWGFAQDGLFNTVTANEIAPSVYLVAGSSHNSLVVDQGTGVVVVETPQSEVRSQAILDWIDEEFDLPVTHALISHHHSDHSSGLRHFVGNGATPVMHELSAPLFEGVFAAESTLIPDALAENPRTVEILTVTTTSPVTVGTVNPVSAYHFGGEHANDMIMIDAAGVLFFSDIYNPGLFPGPIGPIGPMIRDRVDELGLSPVAIAGGHGSFITYEDFLAQL